jgi:O-antigen/teichoic acid export membrane protein
MIKSGLYLGLGSGFAALLGLVRNVAIARLISVEDFGIASTFAITMALIEMMSYIAIDRLIIQARDGGSEQLQSTAQLLQVVRGVLGAIVLFLVAAPLASLFGVPKATWAYQALAAIPLIRGFAHLDMFRTQRDMLFVPAITVEAVAQIVATGAAILLALRLGDYSAMLYALLIQQAVFVLASHVVATRPYRLGYTQEIAARALAFGWPLLLNGLLLFGILHGDRVIVGSAVGITELGWFSAAVTLTLMPTVPISKTLLTFFLPQLARLRDDEVAFRRLQIVVIEFGLLIGGLFTVALTLAGPAILIAVYGPRYEAAVAVLALLAVMQGLRIVRSGFSAIALAKAKTHYPMMANLLRVAMLPLAWVAVREGGGVVSVVMLGILGEGLAVAASLILLKRYLSLSLEGLAMPFTATLALFGLSCFFPLASASGYMDEMGFRLASSALVLLLVWQLWSMRSLRRWGGDLLRQSRRAPDAI